MLRFVYTIALRMKERKSEDAFFARNGSTTRASSAGRQSERPKSNLIPQSHVHVYREENNGEETIRIISARKAEKNDIRRYQKQAVE